MQTENTEKITFYLQERALDVLLTTPAHGELVE
jgi:hypothetical protein